jgi:membrane-associated phospholipid phosphatase
MKTASSSIAKKCWTMTWFLAGIVTIVTLVFQNGFDLTAARFARYGLPDNFVGFIRLFDDTDDSIIIVFVAISLLFLARKNYPLFFEVGYVPLSALTAGISTNILKLFFGRWRPSGFFNDGEYGFTFFAPVEYVLASFPSGHSSSIMAIMTALAVLLPRYKAVFFPAAAVIASFRVIVGAHYPSDVIAGIALGYLSAHWLRYWLVRRNLLMCPSTLQKISMAGYSDSAGFLGLSTKESGDSKNR